MTGGLPAAGGGGRPVPAVTGPEGTGVPVVAFDVAALTVRQRDGLACVVCNADYTESVTAHVPVAIVSGYGQVFACQAGCAVPAQEHGNQEPGGERPVEALSADVHVVIAVVVEALAVPPARSIAEDDHRSQVLKDRIGALLATLSTVATEDRTDTLLSRLGSLRERLAAREVSG